MEEMQPVGPFILGLLMCSLFSGLGLARDDPLEVLWVTDVRSMDLEARYLRSEPMIDAIIVPGYRGGVSLSTLEVRRLVSLPAPPPTGRGLH